jgi:hypothetical protein
VPRMHDSYSHERGATVSPTANDPPGTSPNAAENAAAAEAAALESKRKFREALDRKKQQSSSPSAGSRKKSGGVNQAHGPVSHQREFRRKSG